MRALAPFVIFAVLSTAAAPRAAAQCVAPAPVTGISLVDAGTAAPYPSLGWTGPALSGLDYFEVEVAGNAQFDPVAARFTATAPTGPWVLPPAPLWARARAVHACPDGSSAASPWYAAAVTQAWGHASFRATPTGPSAAGDSVSFTFTNTGALTGGLTLSPDSGVALQPTVLNLLPGASGRVDASLYKAFPGFVPFTFGARGGGTVATYGGTFCTTPSPVPAGSANGTAFTISPAELHFQEPGGTGAPGVQGAQLRTTTLRTLYPLLAVPADAPWLKITGSASGVSSMAPMDLSVRVDPTARPAGDSSTLRAIVNVWPAGSDGSTAVPLLVTTAAPHRVTAGSGRTAPGAREPLAGTPGAFVVPTVVAASNAEFGVTYRSDLWIRNDGPSAADVSLVYTPEGVDGAGGAGVLSTALSVPASTTAFLSDVVGEVFGAAGSGQLEVRSSAASLLSVRSTTEATTGGDLAKRFGTEIPVVAAGSGIALGGEALVAGIADDAANRSNLIAAETSGAPATLRVTVYDPSGGVVGTLAPDPVVPAWGKVQVNRLVAAVAPGAALSGGWCSVRVVAGAGRVVALATVIDNRTNSFSAVRGRVPAGAAGLSGSAADAIVVPSCARLVGAYGTTFTTSLSVVNGGGAPASLSLAYFYVDKASGTSSSVVRNVSIPPRGALAPTLSRDVIASLFGLTKETYGWIRITGDLAGVSATVAVSSQIDPADPSKGLKTSGVDALLVSDAAVWPVGAFRAFAGLERSLSKRTNLILVETAGQAGTAKVQLWDRRGYPVGTKTFPLAPFQYLQINDVVGSVADALGIGVFQDVQAVVSASGSARVVSFASVIDNLSTNPEIFLLLPPGPPRG